MVTEDSWGNSPVSGNMEKDLWGSRRGGSVNVLSHWELARKGDVSVLLCFQGIIGNHK